jgi:RNA polymerase sigma factor (sigma-70 family)
VEPGGQHRRPLIGVGTVLACGAGPTGAASFLLEVFVSNADEKEFPGPELPGSQEFLTSTGVRVVVQPPPPPPTPRPPPPSWVPPPPPIVVQPPERSPADRASILRALFTDYGDYLLAIFHRAGAQPASAEDLRAQVVAILCEQLEGERPLPAELRPYITGIGRNLLKARARARRRGAAWEAELDEEVSPSTSPEGRALRDEQWAKLKRYLDALSEEEAELFMAVRLEDKTVAEVAKERGQAWTTVNDQLRCAQEKIEALARASERAAALRAQTHWRR